jgi:aspartate/methionine/tyrosine aminotransferase
MSAFQPFEIERLMSRWEHEVDYNLSESGVHPVPLRDLLPDSCALREFLDTELGYPQTNGTLALRENISRLYPGASPENVLTTVGAVEANGIALASLFDPGDEIAVMLPNYLQIWGMALNASMRVNAFFLRETGGDWKLDLNELNTAVTDKTKLIAITNPNNPTGHILSEEEIDALVAAAARVGAWILTDEVYAGAERLAEKETPSLWGRYDKVLAIGSLSKAYGLPGLRTGWVVAPPQAIEEIWHRHDYATIAIGKLAMQLATVALSPDRRPKLIDRTRGYVRRGFPIMDAWLQEQEEFFGACSSEAGAIAFVSYRRDVKSEKFVDELRESKSVLIVPGEHFGLDGYVRISTGLDPKYLNTGLARISEFIHETVN